SATSPLGSSSAAVTVVRSGFVLDGGTGVGATFPATFPGSDSVVTVIPVSLDGSGNPLLALPLAPGISASVNVSSSNQGVGTILGSPVTLNGGNTSTTVTFHPTGVGATTISASASGYTTPSSGGSVGALVQQANILLTTPSVPIGFNLELPTTVILAGTSSSSVQLKLTANGSIKLSANGNDAGASTLNLTLAPNQNSAVFYIYGQASSGTATIGASAPGFNSASATVTLAPSGFIISGPFGAAPVFQTSVAAGAQNLTVQPAVLDASNNYITTENLAGSKGPVNVTITNQYSNIGSVPSSVTVPVHASTAVTFTPKQSGQTTITLGQPTGFTAPAQNATNPQGALTVAVQ